MKQTVIATIVGFAAATAAVVLFTPKQVGAPSEKPAVESSSSMNGPNAAYDRIIKTGVLGCGYAMYAPVAFIKDPNTKEYSGFVPDYLALMAKNLGIKIEYVEDAGYGPQAIEGLKTGRFDAFCTGLNKNAPRGREIMYTDTIWYAPIYAYVKPSETRFDTNLDLINDPNVTLSIMDGEATDAIAKNLYTKAKTFALPQNSEMSLLYSNVAQGKADVVFSDPMPADAFNKNNPTQALRRVNDTPVMMYTLGIAIDNDEPKLQAMLNAALMELQASGRIKAMIKKYDPTMDSYKTPAFVFDQP